MGRAACPPGAVQGLGGPRVAGVFGDEETAAVCVVLYDELAYPLAAIAAYLLRAALVFAADGYGVRAVAIIAVHIFEGDLGLSRFHFFESVMDA